MFLSVSLRFLEDINEIFQNVEHVSVNYFADFGPSIEMR